MGMKGMDSSVMDEVDEIRKNPNSQHAGRPSCRYLTLKYTYRASKTTRVWTPSGSSTHRHHPPLRNQTWVTAVEHH